MMTKAAEVFENAISLLVSVTIFAAVLLTITGQDVTIVVDALISLLPALVVFAVFATIGVRILEELP